MMSGGMRLMRPHFVDPQTNIVYDTNSADFEGWLTKQSSWLKVQCRKQIGFVLVCMCTFFYRFTLVLQFCSWEDDAIYIVSTFHTPPIYEYNLEPQD